LKIIDQTILSNEDLSSNIQCCICGDPLTLTKNSDGNYVADHCDRSVIIYPVKFLAVVRKNKNIVITKERKHLDHPDPVIKQRRYI